MSYRSGGLAATARVAVLLVVLLVMIGAFVYAVRSERPGAIVGPATPTPTAAPTLATPAATATGAPATASPTRAPLVTPPLLAGACRNEYVGETPVVPPRKSGQHADVAVDSIRVGQSTFGDTTRWNVRFFDPSGSPGAIRIPLRAQVRSASGAELRVVGYEAGPPNAGTVRVTQDVEVNPCDPRAVPGTPDRGVVVLVVHTAPITSGSFTLSLRDVQLPEGVTRTETWELNVTCRAVPGPGTECR